MGQPVPCLPRGEEPVPLCTDGPRIPVRLCVGISAKLRKYLCFVLGPATNTSKIQDTEIETLYLDVSM